MDITKLDNNILNELIEKSRLLPRKRASHVIRSFKDKDIPSVLFNVLQPGTYIRPHRHISEKGKEILIPIKKCLKVIFFDEVGNIIKNFLIGSEKISYLEIPPRTFHTVIATEPDSILCELYMDHHEEDKEYKEFAIWSPEESTQEAEEYLKRLVTDASNIQNAF